MADMRFKGKVIIDITTSSAYLGFSSLRNPSLKVGSRIRVDGTTSEMGDMYLDSNKVHVSKLEVQEINLV